MQDGARTRRPAAAAVLALPRGFFRFFELFLEKVKKPPLLRIEPTVSPIFGRGRDQYTRSLVFRRERVFP